MTEWLTTERVGTVLALVSLLGGNVYQASAPPDCGPQVSQCARRCDAQLEGQSVRDSDECWKIIERMCDEGD